MITTTIDYQKLQDLHPKPLHFHFRLSFVVAIARGQFLRDGRGRKPQVCRRNCNDICHNVGDISTSGLDGHIAISGCPSMSHLFVDAFFEFGVVEKFVYRARITVILCFRFIRLMSLWLWLCVLDDDLLLLPVLSVVLKMYMHRCLYSCLVILPFSVSNIQKYHFCEVYIFAS